MSNDKSGPAFPSKIANPSSSQISGFAGGEIEAGKVAYYQGVSMRDYFAAKFAAAQSVMTSADRDFIKPDNRYPFEDGPTVAEKIARTSYALADAMLKERSK